MAQATTTDELPARDTLATLNRGKLAMWIFLASEVLFFCSLIAVFVVYVTRSPRPYTQELNELLLVSFNSFVLLGSSFTVVMALDANQRGNQSRVKLFLGLTLLLGLIFIGVQAYEYNEMINHHGITLSSNLYGTAFFTLTGFHGLHVIIGLVWIVPLLIRALRNQITPEKSYQVEFFGLYWHFVDVVWVVLFTLVYLVF